MEYRQLVKDGKLLMYKIVYKNTRNISAKLDNNNQVVVTCPEYLQKQYIDDFVLMHFDKFYNFIEEKKNNSLIDWTDNKITLLGVPHTLHIQPSSKKDKYEIIGDRIYLFLKSEENKKKLLYKMLTNLGHDYLVKKVKYWLKQIGDTAFSIDTKWYDSKWGQCEYRTKAITIAIQLYMLNEELIDYVIIHEICHLTHPNHSSKFWKMVEKYYPKYKIAKNKLKYHS